MASNGNANFRRVDALNRHVNQLNVTDVNVANGLTVSDSLVLGTESLTGAGALSVATPVSFLDTTGGAVAVTLAAPTTAGQVKHIIMVKDGGDATLTIADPAGAANTYVFANVGESLTLIGAADEDRTIIGWAEMSRGSGAAAGATAVAGLPAASAV